MSKHSASVLLALVLALVGCAAPRQTPVPLAGDYARTAKSGRIGIAMSELPAPDTAFPGAVCLLCMATASAANSSLTKHTRTLNADELKPLKEELSKLLTARGFEVVVLPDPLRMDSFAKRSSAAAGQARQDFSSLREAYKIDRLLLVHVAALGFTRPYSAYIAQGDPRAMMEGSSYIVRLADHTLEWYEPLSLTQAADGKWDEPPSFPGLTNAYYQVLETGKDAVKKPFLQK